MDPPVIHPAALIGATVLRASLRLGHLDSNLGEVLHDEDETREGENYLRDLSNPLRDLPEGAGGGDVQLLDVVAPENFPQLLDPLVLGEDGQRQPLGPGDQDDFLQVAVDILLILNSSETRRQRLHARQTKPPHLPGLLFQHRDVELHQVHHGWHEVLPQVPADVLPAQQDVESEEVAEAAMRRQLRENCQVEGLAAIPHRG